MKIALVYAGITECGFNSIRGNEGSWMNHGLAIISAVSKKAGHEVVLLDLRRMTGWDDFRRRVSETNADVFGLTMMSVDYDSVAEAAAIIRDVRPESKIVVGGPHPSICPEELESVKSVDYIFRSEGELTFPKLLNSIEKRESFPRVIQGERLDNLDAAPWADRELFQSPEEPFVPFLKPPFVTLIAGRGCKYNCNYCQPAERIMFGHNVRRRSVANVIAELEVLRSKYNFNSFMIHDDCLTEDRSWVLEFCDSLKKEGFQQPFVAQSRADIICNNADMIKVMSQAGLRLMIIGFESGSDRVLRYLRKGCTRQKNLKAAQICRAIGVKVWANYMLGLPTETKEEVMETYTMLEEIRPYHCSPAFYTPHPGSDLFTIGKEMGIHLITNHKSYRRSTYEPKIKGPDYEFLTGILYKSVALGEDNFPPKETRENSPAQFFFKNLAGRLKIILLSRFPGLCQLLKRLMRS